MFALPRSSVRALIVTIRASRLRRRTPYRSIVCICTPRVFSRTAPRLPISGFRTRTSRIDGILPGRRFNRRRKNRLFFNSCLTMLILLLAPFPLPPSPLLMILPLKPPHIRFGSFHLPQNPFKSRSLHLPSDTTTPSPLPRILHKHLPHLFQQRSRHVNRITQHYNRVRTASPEIGTLRSHSQTTALEDVPEEIKVFDESTTAVVGLGV